MTVNASLGSVVYCVMSRDFRRELARQLHLVGASSKAAFGGGGNQRLPRRAGSHLGRYNPARDVEVREEEEGFGGPALRRLLPRGAIIRNSTRRRPRTTTAVLDHGKRAEVAASAAQTAPATTSSENSREGFQAKRRTWSTGVELS